MCSVYDICQKVVLVIWIRKMSKRELMAKSTLCIILFKAEHRSLATAESLLFNAVLVLDE